MHIVAGDAVSTEALYLLCSANDALTYLAHGQHGRTAGRILVNGQFLKPLQLLDQNDPNRTTTGLCTKDVRQLQHANAHVLTAYFAATFS